VYGGRWERPSTRICADTQMSGGATLYTPDYETHRGRTMDAIETFPLTFGLGVTTSSKI
jgi:hypothetical protein